MIYGTVSAAGEAIIRLQVRNAGGHIFVVSAIVDTGFDGAIALPESLLKSLGFLPYSRGSIILADDTDAVCDVYWVEVEWDGAWQNISVVALGNNPFLGCALFRDYELRIEFKPAGAVEIQKL